MNEYKQWVILAVMFTLIVVLSYIIVTNPEMACGSYWHGPPKPLCS